MGRTSVPRARFRPVKERRQNDTEHVMTHTRVSLTCLFLLAPFAVSLARDTYRLPPAEVIEIVDAPPSPTVRVSPDGQWMLLIEHAALPSIADLSRRMLRLAGMRIDPAANGRYRASTVADLQIRRAA